MSGTNSTENWSAIGTLTIEEHTGYIRDYTASQPYHLLHEARALVAGVQLGRCRSLVDRPYVKKSVISSPQAGKIFLIGAESNSSNTEGMFI
jgi:hypothetical protein